MGCGRKQLRTGTADDRRVRDALMAEACAVFHLTPPTVAATPPPSSTPGVASGVKKGWAPTLEFRVGSRQPDLCPFRGDWMRRPIAHNEVRVSPTPYFPSPAPLPCPHAVADGRVVSLGVAAHEATTGALLQLKGLHGVARAG